MNTAGSAVLPPGNGIPGQGYSGGQAYLQSAGGGGGGAGGVGGAAASKQGGNGGPGIANPLTGVVLGVGGSGGSWEGAGGTSGKVTRRHAFLSHSPLQAAMVAWAAATAPTAPTRPWAPPAARAVPAWQTRAAAAAATAMPIPTAYRALEARALSSSKAFDSVWSLCRRCCSVIK